MNINRKPWPYECNDKVHELVSLMMEELSCQRGEKRINIFERYLQKAYDLGVKSK